MRAGLTASVGLTANPTANPTADMTADLAQARAWHQAGQLDLARQGYLALLARPACAAVMAESALFASFSYLEGLGLPPQEAMASGCLVGCLVGGFDGHGGRDDASADNGRWVAEGDHEGFADALAALLDDWVGDGDAAQRRIDAGLATAATYSQARFEQELLAAWRAITGPRWGDYLNRVSR